MVIRTAAEERRSAATLATLTSAALIVVTIAIALLTGSVAALAAATHAAAELLRTIVAAFGARGEERPGGPVVQAGVIEGLLVLAAGGVAAYAALRGFGDVVRRPLVALVSLASCALLAWTVAVRVEKVAAETGSRALLLDASSLRSSQNTGLIASGALAVVVLLHVRFPDGAAALVIAAIVARVGIDLTLSGIPGRERLGSDELGRVTEAIAAGPPEVVGYGRIRARSAGGVRRIDVDVTVQRDVDAARLERVRSEIESLVARRLPGLRIVVHLRKPAVPSGKARAG